MKLAWGLGLMAVVGILGCRPNNAIWMRPDVHTRGAIDLSCSQVRTVVVELGQNSYQVVGCGYSRAYVCRGGACSADGDRMTLPADHPLLGVNGEVQAMVRLLPTALERAVEDCGPVAPGTLIQVEVDPAKGKVFLNPDGEGVRSRFGRCYYKASAGRVSHLRTSYPYWFYFDPQSEQQPVTRQPAPPPPAPAPAMASSAVAPAPVPAVIPAPVPDPSSAPADPAFAAAVRVALDAQAADLFACSNAERLVVEVIADAAAAHQINLTGNLSGSAEEACVRAAVDLSTLPEVTTRQRVIHLLRAATP